MKANNHHFSDRQLKLLEESGPPVIYIPHNNDNVGRNIELESGVVLQEALYQPVWQVMSDRNETYNHISNSHASLPQTLSFQSTNSLSSSPNMKKSSHSFRGSPLNSDSSHLVPQIGISTSISSSPEESREKLKNQLKNRYTGDREGRFQIELKMKDYLSKAEKEDEDILNLYNPDETDTW